MSLSNYKILIADLSHLEAFIDHDIRHMREPGYNGQHAHPIPYSRPLDKEKRMEIKRKSWSTPVTEESWCRTFIVLKDSEIVGHLNLGNSFFPALHRAQLGMGLEQKARNIGLGSLVMKTALDWALDQPSLLWVDLFVLDHNLPAKKLYSSFGFNEHYTIKDMFRVDGVSIDDTYMSLKLHK